MATQLVLSSPAGVAARPRVGTAVTAGWLWITLCVVAAAVGLDPGFPSTVLPGAAVLTFGCATQHWRHRMVDHGSPPWLLRSSITAVVVASMGLVALSVSAMDGLAYVGLEALLAMTIFAGGSLLLSLGFPLLRRTRRPIRDAAAAIAVGVLAMSVWAAVGADLLLVPWSACVCLLLLKR